jgi:hypothetical protein
VYAKETIGSKRAVVVAIEINEVSQIAKVLVVWETTRCTKDKIRQIQSGALESKRQASLRI